MDQLAALLEALSVRGYRFVTPTPATHARRLAKLGGRRARSLTDALGWSLPFNDGALPGDVLGPLRAAELLEPAGSGWRARVRVSSLHGRLYLHSAYPTDAADAVFFGPDSYRFADLVAAELAGCTLGEEARIADVGGGAGVGAITAAAACPRAHVVMTDVNADALRLAAVNARMAGFAVEGVLCSGLDAVAAPLDVVTLNPPFIADHAERAYRHGGTMHGGQLSIDLTVQALDRLAPGGRVILYTGSAIVDGQDRLRATLEREAAARGCGLRYRELDPDVFGEELDEPAYDEVERIALVAAVLTRD